MSADNYLWVRKWRGEYVIEHRSASIDYDERRKPRPSYVPYRTAGEAIHAAWIADDTEYGVRVAVDVQEDMLAETQHKGK